MASYSSLITMHKYANVSTVELHYNVSHYSVVFYITRPCHGSKIDYSAVCLL